MRLMLLNENVSQLNFIKKHVKDVEPSQIDKVAQLLYDSDPTSNKKYVKWLIKQFNNQRIIMKNINDEPFIRRPHATLPGDSIRLRENLSAFDKFKNRIPDQFRNLMVIDVDDLYALVDKFISVGKSSYVQLGNKTLNGAELLVNEHPYKIFVVRKLNNNDDENTIKINALETLGIGTKWCTRTDYKDEEGGSKASGYLENSDVYVVYKNNKPYIQFDEDSLDIMDVHNNSVASDHISEDLRELIVNRIDSNSIQFSWLRVYMFDSRNQEDIGKILSKPDLAYNFVHDIYRDRLPEAERTIMKDPQYAYYYARDIIGGRWPEAEPYIMKDAKFACYYADEIIGGRWPEAEPYIMQDLTQSVWYANYVIGGRWPEAEPHIMKDKTAYAIYNDYLNRG